MWVGEGAQVCSMDQEEDMRVHKGCSAGWGGVVQVGKRTGLHEGTQLHATQDKKDA